MLALKNSPTYYITIQANRESEIKTLYAGESFGDGGFFIDFDKAKRFSCPLAARRWFEFNFDETNLPPDYYDWTTVTIEELKLVPVEKIILNREYVKEEFAKKKAKTKTKKIDTENNS